ncbi:unnamed protein product [Candidula unifasciata]|uniref:Uncharacterized protein n=1 Tax=Candidula unifasciata TaxID=100452 RepID=A0A8S3ZN30_9EUPU|nr:unnamed protein product [Candidula unifasciata]
MSLDYSLAVRGKEVSAVMCNQKEQRVLEKCLQTLHLEQTYAVKLLEIDNREMKVHYKKLKDKVSKIKSFLPIEDISRFRELDMKGRFKPAYECVVLSSAVKIAEASRRLKLNSHRGKNGRCTQSALPRISVSRDNSHIKTNSRESDSGQRSKSVMGLSTEISHETHSSQQEKPSTVQFYSVQDDNLLGFEKSTPVDLQTTQETPIVFELSKRSQSAENGGHNLRAQSGHIHTHSPFSSHVAAAKDARDGLRTAPAQTNIARRLSQVSNYSIDSNLGENLYEERRLGLLEEEALRAAALQQKTRKFLHEVEEYLQVKPRLPSSKSVTGNSTQESTLGKPSTRGYNRHQKFNRKSRLSEPNSSSTYLHEQKYKEHALSLWTGLNKCRYLRVPDEMLDLSGINTLAKDQMQMFEVLRKSDCIPLREAWEN